MPFKQIFKKVRPFVGIIIFVSLMLFCTAIVFFSVLSGIILPLLWMIFTLWHQLKKENRKVTYLWNATRFSMWVYFSTIFLLLIWTPDWVARLNILLSRKTLFNVFSPNSRMYGRICIAFILSVFVFLSFFFHYKWGKFRLKKVEAKSENTDDLVQQTL